MRRGVAPRRQFNVFDWMYSRQTNSNAFILRGIRSRLSLSHLHLALDDHDPLAPYVQFDALYSASIPSLLSNVLVNVFRRREPFGREQRTPSQSQLCQMHHFTTFKYRLVCTPHVLPSPSYDVKIRNAPIHLVGMMIQDLYSLLRFEPHPPPPAPGPYGNILDEPVPATRLYHIRSTGGDVDRLDRNITKREKDEAISTISLVIRRTIHYPLPASPSPCPCSDRIHRHTGSAHISPR